MLALARSGIEADIMKALNFMDKTRQVHPFFLSHNFCSGGYSEKMVIFKEFHMDHGGESKLTRGTVASLVVFEVRTAKVTPGLTLLAFFSVLRVLSSCLLHTLLFRLPLILSPQNPLSPLMKPPWLAFPKWILGFMVAQQKSILVALLLGRWWFRNVAL